MEKVSKHYEDEIGKDPERYRTIFWFISRIDFLFQQNLYLVKKILKTSPSGRIDKSSRLGEARNYAVNKVYQGLRDHDVELFFPETTTYTAIYGEFTPPKLLSESSFSCPQRMSLTQSGRLCFVYAMDLSLI